MLVNRYNRMCVVVWPPSTALSVPAQRGAQAASSTPSPAPALRFDCRSCCGQLRPQLSEEDSAHRAVVHACHATQQVGLAGRRDLVHDSLPHLLQLVRPERRQHGRVALPLLLGIRRTAWIAVCVDHNNLCIASNYKEQIEQTLQPHLPLTPHAQTQPHMQQTHIQQSWQAEPQRFADVRICLLYRQPRAQRLTPARWPAPTGR